MGKPLQKASSRRFRPIPNGVSVYEIADRCRQGLVEFVAGAAGGWSRVDLDLWLGAPYGSATATFADAARTRAHLSLALEGVEGAFETTVMEAADEVRDLLATAATGRIPAFVELAVDCGFVAPAQDANGALGYVPVDLSGMTLVERVGALLAADLLTRPNDYKSVSICEDCGAVSFEWTDCEHSRCVDLRERESGVVRRDDGAPVSYAAIFPPAEY